MEKVNHILLIDEPVYNSINKQLIQRANVGAFINTCGNAREALEELKTCIRVNYEEFPDVIFLDPEKPELNAWAFLDELHKFPEWIVKKCRVFLLSAASSKGIVEKLQTYPMIGDVLPKPLTSDVLGLLAGPQQSIAA
jgi:CheY-like chemotaxis protein